MQDYSVMASSIGNCFTDAYLFGSALRIGSPNDVDLLLVYERSQLERVEGDKRRLTERFLDHFPDLSLHTTTLSREEMECTQFLEFIQHVRLK